jgi:hypothetical protein
MPYFVTSVVLDKSTSRIAGGTRTRPKARNIKSIQIAADDIGVGGLVTRCSLAH